MAQKICVACTIGPVFNTLSKAKYPLEIWMASYLFSRFAEMVVDRFRKDERVEMVSPSADGCDEAKKCKGIGLYSDHIFLKMKNASEEEAWELIAAAKEAAVSELAAEIKNTLSTSGLFSLNTIKKDLDKNIYVLSVVRPIEADKDIPVHELTEQLDLLECYPPYEDRMDANNPGFLEQYLIDLRRKVDKNKWKIYSEWVKEQCVNMDAIDALSKEYDEDDPDDRWEYYVALVQADGDAVGSLLRCLSEQGKIETFKEISTFLFKQGIANAEKVRAFGAVPIYFGGDDMLFMASLKKDEKTIFELVGELAEDFAKGFQSEFSELIKTLNEGSKKRLQDPSLSFGVSVCHRRYPLNLIRTTAYGAMMDAKGARWTNGREKSAVKVELRKHSGQQSSFCLETREDSYRKFNEILKMKMDAVSLHALHWKIHEQKTVIGYLLMDIKDKTKRSKRVDNWLKMNFNESDPSEKDIVCIRDFLCLLADEIWDEGELPAEMSGEDKEKAKKSAFGQLMHTIDGVFRINELINHKVKEEEAASE